MKLLNPYGAEVPIWIVTLHFFNIVIVFVLLLSCAFTDGWLQNLTKIISGLCLSIMFMLFSFVSLLTKTVPGAYTKFGYAEPATLTKNPIQFFLFNALSWLLVVGCIKITLHWLGEI